MKQFLHITASTIFMLLVFCLPMSAFEYVDVTPLNSKVSKVDVGGEKVSRPLRSKTTKLPTDRRNYVWRRMKTNW